MDLVKIKKRIMLIEIHIYKLSLVMKVTDFSKCVHFSHDHIIDMGPEGGVGGGQVVAAGTPEQVVKEAKSYTGKFLQGLLPA